MIFVLISEFMTLSLLSSFTSLQEHLVLGINTYFCQEQAVPRYGPQLLQSIDQLQCMKLVKQLQKCYLKPTQLSENLNFCRPIMLNNEATAMVVFGF